MEISTQAMIDSLEISKLVESRHSDVKRSIERLVKRGIIQPAPMAVCGRINELGFKQTVNAYQFEGEQGKRDSIIVVAQLSPEFTARLVDRWIELEQSVRTPELPASPTYITSDQVKSGLALLELSSRIVTVSSESLLQGLRNLQKAAGLPELFPDAEPEPTNTKPPAPAKQPALPQIKQPMSSLTKLLERHEIRAPAQAVYIMMHRQGLVERKYKANTAKLETFWAFTEKGLRFGENVEFSKKAKQTQPRFYDERFKGLLFLLGYED